MFTGCYITLLYTEFEAVKPNLTVQYTSQDAGFVTTRHQKTQGTVCEQLTVPKGHVIALSPDLLYTGCQLHEEIHSMRVDDTEVYTYSRNNYGTNTKLFKATRIKMCVSVRTGAKRSCYKMRFSFHPESKVPQRLSSGLFNCSTDDYRRFKSHLDCNLKVECADGRDETGHCPFSSPACQGWVAEHHKCYMLFQSPSQITGRRVRDACRTLGFEMASVKTEQELNTAFTLLWGLRASAFFGLTCSSRSKPFMYRWFIMWSDKTIIYNANHLALWCSGYREDEYYVFHTFDSKLKIEMRVNYDKFVCEKRAVHEDVFVSPSADFSPGPKSPVTFQQTRQTLVICPEGHVTHAFLSCDWKSRCGQTVCYFVTKTSYILEASSADHLAAATVALYSCSSGNTDVSYSLLCDFRQDCADNSDESFCYHPPCTGFTCTNGQCVPQSKHCNNLTDCLDGSDEKNCPRDEDEEDSILDHMFDHQNQNNSFLINLDGSGYFTQRVMNVTESCIGTHYHCTKEWFYCLPVYTRCNGVFDCIFQEDERDCEGWTCPGLYRCRDSTVCVHADHMCDGWPQCPQRDDEWLCDMTCPAQCLCQGHAFLCPQPFSLHLFPQIRYLDARGSGMTLFDLRNNTYIVHLSLAQCSLSSLASIMFPNLQILDLSYNKLTRVKLHIFIEMPNLQTLVLRWNPLTSITNPSKELKNLKSIDLSGTHLGVFDSTLLSYIPEIRYINISFSALRSIDPNGFQLASDLKVLDMREIVINGLPEGLFRGLTEMEKIYASYYKVCCEEILPRAIPQPRCQAPQHYLSSCDYMLQSEVYRFNFWFVVVVAMLANLVCFVCHCVNNFLPMPYAGPVSVFMANLQCADFCMGIHASVIATANEAFRGQYVHFEDSWTDSVACKVAGFFSQLSGEVSTLIIFCLALEHFMLLCFPHDTCRFSKGSAAVTCGVTWIAGILLASIPLLPALSHWGHYDQTAVCSLILQDRCRGIQHFRFIHAILVFNSLVCLAVFVLQVSVYKGTPQHRVLIERNKNPVFSSVDLQMKIAAIDVARWLTISAVSVLALSGVVGIEINVLVVVMVLPLNSAVNPLLCLWHAVTYRQRRQQEERLLLILKLRSKCVPRVIATHRQRKDER